MYMDEGTNSSTGCHTQDNSTRSLVYMDEGKIAPLVVAHKIIQQGH